MPPQLTTLSCISCLWSVWPVFWTGEPSPALRSAVYDIDFTLMLLKAHTAICEPTDQLCAAHVAKHAATIDLHTLKLAMCLGITAPPPSKCSASLLEFFTFCVSASQLLSSLSHTVWRQMPLGCPVSMHMFAASDCSRDEAGLVQVAAAGMMINTMGWVEGLGFELLLHTITAMKANIVLVVGQDRLLSQLQSKYQVCSRLDLHIDLLCVKPCFFSLPAPS